MKAGRLRWILLFLLVFALVTGCAGTSKTEEKTDPVDSPESTEDLVEETEEPAESEDPETVEELELVWSHEYDDNINGIDIFDEKLAVGEFRSTYIHHLSDGSIINVLPEFTAMTNVEFSADGRFLGLAERSVDVLELKDNAEAQRLGGGFDSCLAFSPDGLHIAGGDREGIVWIWELEGLNQVDAIENLDLEDASMLYKLVAAIDYHPSGKLLAATHGEGRVYIWDLEEKEVIKSMDSTGGYSTSSGFRFSPNGKEMAYSLEENDEYLIRLLDVDDGKEVRDIVVPRGVKDLAFSPDGKLLAVASREATTIWDLTSGELRYRLDHEDKSPSALKFTADGGHLVIGYRWENTIELWRFPGSEPIAPPAVDMRTPPPLSADLLFDKDSSELKEEAYVELEGLAEEIYANFSQATITFIGHTDSQGDVYTNLRISSERAEAVKEWFQKWADEKGASEWTLLSDGKGESELKVPDVDVLDKFLEDAAAVNRRIEIEIETSE